MENWSDYLLGAHNEASLQSCRGVYLTNKHSRSLTVYHSLVRLGLLPVQQVAQTDAAATDGSDGEAAAARSTCSTAGHNVDGRAAAGSRDRTVQTQHTNTQPSLVRTAAPGFEDGDELRITIAGADRNEGTNAAETAARFSELVRLVAATGVKRMRILLSGPGICRSIAADTIALNLGAALEASAPLAAPQRGSNCRVPRHRRSAPAAVAGAGTAAPSWAPDSEAATSDADDDSGAEQQQQQQQQRGWWRGSPSCSEGEGALGLPLPVAVVAGQLLQARKLSDVAVAGQLSDVKVEKQRQAPTVALITTVVCGKAAPLAVGTASTSCQRPRSADASENGVSGAHAVHELYTASVPAADVAAPDVAVAAAAAEAATAGTPATNAVAAAAAAAATDATSTQGTSTTAAAAATAAAASTASEAAMTITAATASTAAAAADDDDEEDEEGLFLLRVAYAPGFFHKQEDMVAGPGAEAGDLDSVDQPPHLVACFNAGVWGYGPSWSASFMHATQVLRSHVVVTAYSREEAEDDADIMEQEELGLQYAWEAEENPFRSMRPWGLGNCFNRQEPVDNCEDLLENHWWQCLQPPELTAAAS